MPVPTVDPLPPSPLATDSDAAFDAKAFPFFAAWNTYRTQMIALGVFTEEQADAALAAAVAGGTLPSLAGKALQYLRVNVAADGVEFNAIPTQTQAAWNTGTSTAESLISAEKLDTKIKNDAGGVLLGPFTTNAVGSVLVTGIPSWATEISVLFDGCILNDTGFLKIQIGTSSGVETTGYLGTAGSYDDSTQTSNRASTGFDIVSRSGGTLNCVATMTKGSGNQWFASYSGAFTRGGGDFLVTGGGVKTLGGVLDRIELNRSTVITFGGGSFAVRCR